MSALMGGPGTGANGRDIRDLLRFLGQTMPRQALLMLSLMLAMAATEWIGLLLLVPLLGVVGLEVGEGTVGRIGRLVSDVFGTFGLRPALPLVLAGYVVVVSGRALLQRWQTLTSIRLQEGLVHGLRARLYRGIVYARWIYLARTRSSDFMTSLLAQAGRVGHATFYLLGLVLGAALGGVYLVLALAVSPEMTLLACASGLGLVALQRRGTRRARASGERLLVDDARVVATVSEHLGALKATKSYGAEARTADLFSRVSRRLFETYQTTARDAAAVRAGHEVGSVVALAAMLYVAIRVVGLSGAEVLLLLFLFSRLVPRFSGMQQSYNSLVNVLPTFRQLQDRLAEVERERETEAAGEASELVLRRGIRLEDVEFSYRAEAPTRTLSAVTLEIPARRMTAIVGPSGAGKSTLADLIMGLLAPDRGTVSVDGVALSPAHLAGWRARVGYVPQDTFLFHDTIRANLLWARPEATEEEILSALRSAAAESFVRQLPQGLDTLVGDRGVLLSGGERQRLALARALLRRPSLLILDEATSDLDSENEEHIREAIDALGGRLTVLLITHRLSAVRHADRIHVLEGGRIVESGTWSELLAGRGRFADLCEAQGIRPRRRLAATGGAVQTHTA